MPRQARIDTPGALHHIIVRGIERRNIFKADPDRYDFLERVGPILEQTRTACYAWALIPNHFHLLLRTGAQPVATVMRRLLTGYAVGYNRRHKRHGHLFQNRYKSILCQEDAYLLELVRYIHLNPLRADLVKDLNALERYPFCGHGVITGKHQHSWQDIEAVLAHYGDQISAARTRYKAFVAKGVKLGRRPELTGGGLIRSTGGWAAVKDMRQAKIHIKSDERILGGTDFVSEILSAANEALERRYALKAKGVDLDFVAGKVAELMNMPLEQIWSGGRYRHLVAARSLLCFWAVRELGIPMSDLARRLGISIVAVSKSVPRGEGIIQRTGYQLDKLKS